MWEAKKLTNLNIKKKVGLLELIQTYLLMKIDVYTDTNVNLVNFMQLLTTNTGLSQVTVFCSSSHVRLMGD